MRLSIKETLLLLFACLPYFYLHSLWEKLPLQVPTHFDINGVANDWSSKYFLLFLPCSLGIIFYFIFKALPYLDPKKKLEQMGNLYTKLRFIVCIFITSLSLYILSVTASGDMKNMSLLFVLLGFFFAFLGNYFQAIRPNYFVGIRTPWTLESESVWRKTHLLGGRLWMIGGLLISILAFIIPAPIYSQIFFGIVAIICIVPIGYSWLEFRKEKME